MIPFSVWVVPVGREIQSVPSLEDVAAAAPAAPLIFQHYMRGDREWTLELFKRAEAAGYRALCVTVDSAVTTGMAANIHTS